MLVQSVLMILFQLALLYVCLLYKPRRIKHNPVPAAPRHEGDGSNSEEEEMLTSEGGVEEKPVSNRPGHLCERPPRPWAERFNDKEVLTLC